MRKIYLLLFVCILSGRNFAQPLIPSTVSEVFNFTVGDTFVYHLVLCPNCLPQYRQDSYFYMAVTDKHYSMSSDTLFYQTNLGLKEITNLDSSVLTHSIQPINYIYPIPNYCFYSSATSDSVFTDSLCFLKKNNLSYTYLSLSCLGSSLYANDLGLVQQLTRDSGFPSEPFLNWDIDLIYSSTQSGVCGSYPASIMTEISVVPEAKVWIQTSPNPATTSFTLQLSSAPNIPTYFQLYDAMGRQVRQEEINSISTTINRHQLPNGIYFWQLLTGQNVLQRGKVMME